MYSMKGCVVGCVDFLPFSSHKYINKYTYINNSLYLPRVYSNSGEHVLPTHTLFFIPRAQSSISEITQVL